MIALALAAQPQVLIADEPTTALDVTVQAQIMDLLYHLQKNKSTLLITHDLSLVASFCDRVLVMYAGEIVEEAEVRELFANPRHPYTQRLLQAIPRIDGKKKRHKPKTRTPPNLNNIKGCAFCSRCLESMNICQAKAPPLFELSSSQKARCWLLDSRRAR